MPGLTKACGMRYPVYGMVRYKGSLAANQGRKCLFNDALNTF